VSDFTVGLLVGISLSIIAAAILLVVIGTLAVVKKNQSSRHGPGPGG